LKIAKAKPQMRLLLDINIILDVIFDRPGATTSSALIARCGMKYKHGLPGIP
jgi:hypothetical protein